MHNHRFWSALALMFLLVAAVPGASLGLSVPDTVTMNSSGKLYEQFQFDHAKHIKVTKECSDCHHHTTGTLVEDPNCIRCHRNSGQSKDVSCRGCHTKDPFSAQGIKERDSNPHIYHLDKPGAKGALHQSCIGCHTKGKKGPVACTACHKKKKEGDAFYNSGEFTPKKKPGSGHGGH